MFASPAYADWEEIGENVEGNTFYVDFDRVRKNGSNVYYGELVDYLEPKRDDAASSKVYKQADCEMFRLKVLSFVAYNEPMGNGSGSAPYVPEPEWYYPSPNSSGEILLKRVCEYAENL